MTELQSLSSKRRNKSAFHCARHHWEVRVQSLCDARQSSAKTRLAGVAVVSARFPTRDARSQDTRGGLVQSCVEECGDHASRVEGWPGRKAVPGFRGYRTQRPNSPTDSTRQNTGVSHVQPHVTTRSVPPTHLHLHWELVSGAPHAWTHTFSKHLQPTCLRLSPSSQLLQHTTPSRKSPRGHVQTVPTRLCYLPVMFRHPPSSSVPRPLLLQRAGDLVANAPTSPQTFTIRATCLSTVALPTRFSIPFLPSPLLFPTAPTPPRNQPLHT